MQFVINNLPTEATLVLKGSHVELRYLHAALSFPTLTAALKYLEKYGELQFSMNERHAEVFSRTLQFERDLEWLETVKARHQQLMARAQALADQTNS